MVQVANSLWGNDAFPGTPHVPAGGRLTIAQFNASGGGVSGTSTSTGTGTSTSTSTAPWAWHKSATLTPVDVMPLDGLLRAL